MNIEKKKRLIKERIKKDYGDPAQSIKILRFIDMMDDSSIPVGYWFLKLEEFKGPVPFKKIVESYCNNISDRFMSGDSMCFSGNQGTGKTMASICVLKRALSAGFSAHYTTAYDIMTNHFSNKYDAIRVAKDADFLVIDEVDSRFFISDAQKEIFSSIYETVLRFRVHNTMPTIVCTNEVNNIFDVFSGQGKHAIESLYNQSFKIIPVAGKDFRKQ